MAQHHFDCNGFSSSESCQCGPFSDQKSDSMVDRKPYSCIFITILRLAAQSFADQFVHRLPLGLFRGGIPTVSRRRKPPGCAELWICPRFKHPRQCPPDQRTVSGQPHRAEGDFFVNRSAVDGRWPVMSDIMPHPPANVITDALPARNSHSAVEKAWTRGGPAESQLAYCAHPDRENAGPYAYSYKLGSVNTFRDPDILSFIARLAHAGAWPDRTRSRPRAPSRMD